MYIVDFTLLFSCHLNLYHMFMFITILSTIAVYKGVRYLLSKCGQGHSEVKNRELHVSVVCEEQRLS